jgi:hypothetical protein
VLNKKLTETFKIANMGITEREDNNETLPPADTKADGRGMGRFHFGDNVTLTNPLL